LAYGVWKIQRDPSDPNSKSRHGNGPGVSDVMPAVRPSPFTNAGLEAQFVGTEACVECHQAEHASYSRTAHSNALSEIDVEAEPVRVQFDHPLSRRRFRVQKRGDQIWHQELVTRAGQQDGEEVLLAEYPVRYTIGSGNHTRSYLIEQDGFLLESPITWYAGGKGWWVSPGYDVPMAESFQRVADVGCIICHAGRVEEADKTRFKVTLHELTIGCESCHGPGGQHVRRRQSTEEKWQGEDLTIVHPAGLDRERAESICAQCHLRGDASVVLRTRGLSDFRPGQLLADFRTDYVLQQPNKQMSVVGHVEQMRLSKCYQSSEMTCTTCHNPHASVTGEADMAHYRATCMQCHDDCGLPHEVRIERQMDDNCIACHMPHGDTDIPHIAFTQHRIGIHGKESANSRNPSTGVLVPIYSESHLPQVERDRNLGLAYLELSDKQRTAEHYQHYRVLAESLLNSSAKRKLRDGDVESARARLFWERGDNVVAVRLAENTLSFEGSSGANTNALLVLGDAQRQLGMPLEAIQALKALVRLRRNAEDWFLLGLCHRESGRVGDAISSLEMAVQIDPSRQDIRQLLTSFLSDISNAAKAGEHHDIFRLLNELK
jgi:predicted CXXCH cytochrome family protein